MLQKAALCPELAIDSAEKKVYGYIWGTSVNDYASLPDCFWQGIVFWT